MSGILNIPATSPLVAPPGPVLDRERRPRVNSRGAQQAALELASVRSPELPRELADPGLAPVARALDEVSDFLVKVDRRKKEANRSRLLNETEIAAQDAWADHVAWREKTNADPDEWEADWESRQEGAFSAILDKVSDEGLKQELTLRRAKFLSDRRFDLVVGGQKERNRRAADSYNALIERAVNEKRYDDAKELKKRAVNDGLAYEAELPRLEAELTNRAELDVRKASRDSFSAMVDHDPWKAYETLSLDAKAKEAFPGFDPGEILSAKATARAAIHQKQREGFEGVSNGLAAAYDLTRPVMAEAEIKAFAKAYRFTEKQTQELLSERMEVIRAREQKGPWKSVEFMELENEMNAYKRAEDPAGEKGLALLRRNHLLALTSDDAGEIMARAQRERFRTKLDNVGNEGTKVPQEISQMFHDYMDADLKAGVWGNTSFPADAATEEKKAAAENFKKFSYSRAEAREALEAAVLRNPDMSPSDFADWYKKMTGRSHARKALDALNDSESNHDASLFPSVPKANPSESDADALRRILSK